jgi:flagellar biosynthetic protein FlhB
MRIKQGAQINATRNLLGLMAEEGDSGEKSEAPTGRRLGNARSKGMTGMSSELSAVLGMTAAFYALCEITPALWSRILLIVKASFTSELGYQAWTIPILQAKFIALIFSLLPHLLFILGLAALAGAGSTLLQTNFLWSWQLVKPKMYMINPLAGIKRIFSVRNYLNLLKQILKLAIIAPIAYSSFFTLVPKFMRLMDVPVTMLLPITAEMASTLFYSIIKLLFGLAILDALYQKYSYTKSLKMAKHEVKDEQKSVEGDEAMRRRIISIGLQRARDRMMKNVPKADVIVTNPTHIAVALSYSGQRGSAPRVLAKGQGHIAARIREIAKRHNIPIVERKPLARALYKMVEVGNEIPFELFKAVAEVLAYVYRLKGKSPIKSQTTKAAQSPLRSRQIINPNR